MKPESSVGHPPMSTMASWKSTTRPPSARCARRARTEELPFCGSDSGGQRAAAIYSLLGTARLNGLDPELYLRLVLTRIVQHPIKTIKEQLPWNLADAIQPSAKAA